MNRQQSSPESWKRRREQFEAPAAPPRRAPVNAAMAAAALLLIGAVTYVAVTRHTGPPPPAAVATSTDGDVRLDAAQFDDSRARFYRYAKAAGREVRFFVVKSADGVIRAAFDTCDVCYRERRGYRQVGDMMVCNNCGKAFPSVDINVLQGGCNPVPLDRTVQDGQVVLTVAALQAAAFYF